MPELMFIGMMAIWGIVPLAAAIWALVTLYRVRTTLDSMRATLERMEQALARR